jgi:hypothetical protein
VATTGTRQRDHIANRQTWLLYDPKDDLNWQAVEMVHRTLSHGHGEDEEGSC